MSKDRDDGFDATRPTLIVKYGGVTRQYRPLDRAVLIVGRSAGCDVGLEAPDVAPVHCVLVRALDGWRIRDCTGRGGTRLNGRSVQDAVLTDEDVVQVGSFSFTMHLPPEERPIQSAEAPDEPRLRRAQRSRHHLARLALRLRNRLAEQAEASANQADLQLSGRHEALDRQAEEVRALQRDVDARFLELKQTARQIAEENLTLTERRGQIEAESAEKQAEIAAARVAREEGIRESFRALEIRGRESACFAGYLHRLRRRLNEQEESLTIRWEEWLREQQEASIAEARRNEKIAHEEALLREQRAEVVRLMGEMRQLRRQPDPADEKLRREMEAENRKRFEAELGAGRRLLDDQIRDLQGRFVQLERSAAAAEGHIAQERTRLAQERETLERLRGELGPADDRSPAAETLVDAPSPLPKCSEPADAEAPRAPSRVSALTE